MTNVYKLSDESIAAIAQLLQLAILTGTDVADHFRMINLTPSDSDPNVLVPTKEYLEVWAKTIQSLSQKADELVAEMKVAGSARGEA